MAAKLTHHVPTQILSLHLQFYNSLILLHRPL